MTKQSFTFDQLHRGGQSRLTTWLKIKPLLLAILCCNISLFAQVTFTPEIFDEDCPETSGSFFIRVYPVYIQAQNNQWATNLGEPELEKRTRKTMEILNTVFNPHQIYFVASPPPGLEDNCYTVYTGQTSPVYEGGITIHIRSDDYANTAAGGTGDGTSSPETYFYVGGNENDIPSSNTPTLIHEMGHCLGLAHPFHQLTVGVCDELTDDCDNNTLPIGEQEPDYYCNCCGDFVCDTEYNNFETETGDIIADTSCCCSVTPTTNISPDIFRNYMSWSLPSRCHDRFTPGQIRRMRCYLHRADESDLEDVLIAPEAISGTVTWSTTQTKSGIIEIPSGDTLIINAPVKMSPGSMFIVRRGGLLIVNSTITSECGGMWGGIIVEGTGTAPQKEQNGQYSAAQGRIVLNQSGTIEHAVGGIGVHGLIAEDADYGGGIAELKGTIKNCTNGVRFGRYRINTNPNVSYIAGALIILNDDYRGSPATKPILTYLQQINELGIASTYFYDNRTQNCAGRESRADGLIAEDAAFRAIQSYFHNLDHGVLSSPLMQSGGYGKYTVRDCNFQNCYTDIYSSLPDPFTIFNNYFLVGRPEACPEESANVPFRGVHIIGHDLPMGIVLSENTFDADDGEEGEYFIGTDCLAAGNMENFIRKNDYEGLTYSNRAAGNNGGATGLRYECNESTLNDVADFYVRNGGTVRSIQGNKNEDLGITTAAGNKFINSHYSWLNEGTGTITYYYDATDPVQNPGDNNSTFEGIDTIVAFQPNPNCGSGGEECPPPCEETDVSAWKSQFSQQKSAWLTKKALYPTVSVEQQEALTPAINAHRSAMDTLGGKVIRNFALDSTGAKVDSVLAWTDSLHRYEADLRLARHHFFAGNYTTYNQWLTDIETRNELSTEQSDELAEFAQMLAVMRPSLQAGTKLHRLSAAVLDSLELWASDCTEPGFIAKEILRRNGRKIISECELEPEERPINTNEPGYSADIFENIRIYPNPSDGDFFLELPAQIKTLAISITSFDGRVVLRKTVTASSELNLSSLPSGLYLVSGTADSAIAFHRKIVLVH